MEETVECGACGGEAYSMGTLGYLAHYRCRNCGMTISVEVSSWEYDTHENDYEAEDE